MCAMSLGFPVNLWADVLGALERALPEEACGFLAGCADRVEAVYPVPNELRSPTAYRMEPAAQIRAMTAIEKAGREIVAIYHSHPNGPPIPSATDVDEASYPVPYVICSRWPGGTSWLGRAFLLSPEGASEVEIDWLDMRKA